MVVIDLPADLNCEDDAGRNVACLPVGSAVSAVQVGVAMIAGTPGFWSWVVVDAVTDGVVSFHQVTAAEAAQL